MIQLRVMIKVMNCAGPMFFAVLALGTYIYTKSKRALYYGIVSLVLMFLYIVLETIQMLGGFYFSKLVAYSTFVIAFIIFLVTKSIFAPAIRFDFDDEEDEEE